MVNVVGGCILLGAWIVMITAALVSDAKERRKKHEDHTAH